MTVDGIKNKAVADLIKKPQPTPAAESKSRMDKDAFLKLLVAQLKAQDPLKPMEGTEFVAQLATFSQVEQSISQTQTLEQISLQLTGLASNEAVGLIGKDVTVRGRFISFDGANPTGFSANLKADAESTEVAILDQAGKPVRTMKLGPKNAGAVTVPWDGRTDSGAKAQPGSYTVQVTATDKAGNPVDVTSDVSGKVVGVSFDKGFPEIILDSGARAPISDLISVRGQTSPTSGAATSTASALAKLAAVQSSIPQISQGVQALIPKI